MKRLVVISDLHCGHRVGLTPPKYQTQGHGRKWWYAQCELWDTYCGMIQDLKPIDILCLNGDAIDGKAPRSGASELIVTDRTIQADMACECVEQCSASEYLFTRGTPYHTGIGEDFENQIAKQFNGIIKDQLWAEIEGVVFDFKHHIGGSSIPHGKGTPIAKDRLWNFLWTEHDEQPKSDVLIRSHVHWFHFDGDEDWMGLTTPALQGAGTKYGARRCSGKVNFGVTKFDVENGKYEWSTKIVHVESQKAKLIKL